MPKFDIIVIGAGHAGIEAAHIAAKMGAKVLLVTSHVDLIGQMSCNPAIGGVAKGNIVREIGALGGLMADLIDQAGIHFRMLNSSKGSAVWGPRAQADRLLYRDLARRALKKHQNITIFQAMAAKLDVSTEKILAVTMDSGEIIATKAVILTAGTFLNGTIHIGLNTFAGGRMGEPSASGLTKSICALGITSGRLRTSSPPRIDGRSVDYSRLTVQRGDADPWPFSFFTRRKLHNKIVCWVVKTNTTTHQHILQNMDRSLQYTGKIQSAGPRYCPSIEDKVVRFGERGGHVLYLEPETRSGCELYLNGFSTGLPCDVQEKMVASMEGLERARIVRPGYGIEYDYFQPLQLKPSLESRIVPGLFFAGQVNGTSGYEEAACQGLMAGINAVLALRGEKPVVLGRDTSYVGVLIDDLVTKGTDEPYRMFTSRAEHRLLLRQDNCDERLMPIARSLGTITQTQYDKRQRFWDKKKRTEEWLGGIRVTPEQYGKMGIGTISQPGIAGELLRRPEVEIKELLIACELNVGCEQCVGNNDNTDTLIPEQSAQQTSAVCSCLVTQFDRFLALGVESEIKYKGFVKKQLKEIEKLHRLEETQIPDDFCYNVPGLLTESQEKLRRICPNTLGQASRIGGITPADISVLAMFLLKAKNKQVKND
ncbi:MAG: tRNA uridine-5-carboxymethylaminomethyl(34) synthesis enzyme MnmG [Chitinispirillales bacterium]|jgi:tRNA uridine 5-carboxymethylaminomethyl modification enzyme|nr:tRNA uridine-5-carboxymethylaminomethyl(34) synthesis enzyme MnmG [Chitinispirillales bacterium]